MCALQVLFPIVSNYYFVLKLYEVMTIDDHLGEGHDLVGTPWRAPGSDLCMLVGHSHRRPVLATPFRSDRRLSASPRRRPRTNGPCQSSVVARVRGRVREARGRALTFFEIAGCVASWLWLRPSRTRGTRRCAGAPIGERAAGAALRGFRDTGRPRFAGLRARIARRIELHRPGDSGLSAARAAYGMNALVTDIHPRRVLRNGGGSASNDNRSSTASP